MLFLRVIAVLVLALSQPVVLPAQPVSLELDPDALAVRQVFLNYKNALMEGDGDTAVRLVDRATLSYYERLKDLTLEGDAETIKGESFIDRLLIVSLRHELEPALLRQMELQDLVAHVVQAGWIRKESIVQLDIGKIEIEGDRAAGEALVNGGSAQSNTSADGEAPFGLGALRYQFAREDGDWKFRFSSLVESLNQTIRQFAAQLGTKEDDLIFMLVESLSGKQVLPEVWDKPQSEG